MEKNVLQWLEKTASNYPNKKAYFMDGKEYTFSEVYLMAQKIGSMLCEVEDSAPIAVLSGRNLDTILAFLGVVYSGHAYAPIDGSLPKERIDNIMSILKPSAILVDDEFLFLEKMAGYNIPIYKFSDCREKTVNEEKLQKIRNKMVMTDPLYVIFTSGSTGKPKGVVTSHQALMCYIEDYTSVMEIDLNDMLGNQSPLDYIAAIRDIYIPLYKGCSMVIIPKEYFMQPNELFHFMNKYNVSAVGWSVSAFTIATALGAFKEVELTSLSKICFSGSIMPGKCLTYWQSHLPKAKFVNQYGPTEATASCTYYVIDHKVSDDELLPIGVPYNHYKIVLLNKDLTETKKGDIGEICISGPILALGYYNDCEKTEKSFVYNPNIKGYPEKIYCTGDYGRIREDGLLEFHGRMDRQIKHMGHRVELDEIEGIVNSVKRIQECISLYDKENEIIYLFYSGEMEKKDLILELRKSLPGYMVPRKVIKLEGLPKLANGKINMNKLKEKM